MAHTHMSEPAPTNVTISPSTEDVVNEVADRYEALEEYLKAKFGTEWCDDCGEYWDPELDVGQEQNPNPHLVDAQNPDGPNYLPPGL